ncbi:MAG: hypothetical protein ACPG6U_13095, partial [Paracoccaceae bacterium]
LSINKHHWIEKGFEAKFQDLDDKIEGLTLVEVLIYGANATGPHRDDLGVIALFKKRPNYDAAAE